MPIGRGVSESMKRPTNEAEFSELMEMVDSDLAKASIPIYARPMRAWVDIAKGLKMALQIGGVSRKTPLDGSYDESDLTIRIFQWYTDRYGDSTKIIFSPGRVLVLLRGIPWVMEFPQIWGSVEVFISRTEPSSPSGVHKGPGIPRHNILDSLKQLPAGLKAALTNEELHMVAGIFHDGFPRFQEISRHERSSLCVQAMADIDSAIGHVVGPSKSFGQSKWASLQAAEKFLKAYIQSRGAEFPKTHNLEKLVLHIQDPVLANACKSRTPKIQCDPSIRYGEPHPSLQEAWDAHWASVLFCGDVAERM